MGRPENPLPDAKTRILDAAERLFMENGYAATSVRMITGAAGVPVALVSYHFGSKQGLMEAVYERTLGSRGGSRVSYLDRLEADAGGQPIPVDVLVDAFLSSALRLTRKDSVPGEVFKQLIGRAFYEPGPARRLSSRRSTGRRWIAIVWLSCGRCPISVRMTWCGECISSSASWPMPWPERT
jgi:AcrR family transcriptional regulator